MNPEALREIVARGGLMAFVRHFWDTIQAVELVEEPHLKLVCRHLEACALNATKSLKPDLSKQKWSHDLEPISYLVIAIPPGMSKSMITSVFLHAWTWSWCPGARFLTTAYAEDLAVDFGRQAFDVMRSEKYRACWPHVEIEDGDRAAMSDFRCTRGGRRWSMSMGGRPTGRHANLLLTDDPVKPDDLKLGGESARESLAQTHYRWDALLSNRSCHPATFTRVIIAQRLHSDDLSGHAIRQGAVHLKLPMEFVPHQKYESVWGDDWRTEPGELLAPERFPQEVIDVRRVITPARDFQAQYQQNPTVESGEIFQEEWFQKQYVGQLWMGKPLAITVDASNKANKNSDYCVIQVWAKVGRDFYLVDQIRRRMGFPEQVQSILDLKVRYPGVKHVLVEAKANGNAIIQQLRTKITGVVELEPLGGKESRAAATTWLWSDGRVYLPAEKLWLKDYIQEHLDFPAASHDDQVDATTQLLAWWSAADKRSALKEAMANVRRDIFGR